MLQKLGSLHNIHPHRHSRCGYASVQGVFQGLTRAKQLQLPQCMNSKHVCFDCRSAEAFLGGTMWSVESGAGMA